jgi:hypothetical protein
MKKLTRRQCLAGGAGLVAMGAGTARPALALDTVRQGYQTNIWGMPTYYLLKSGLLEKRGIKLEEFAVPSGNLTMQQMVARQVDMGTYAAQSFIIGHDKGGLVAIAQIETVGKTAQIVTRRDLNLSKVAELRGLKVANQTGSSVGNVFTGRFDGSDTRTVTEWFDLGGSLPLSDDTSSDQVVALTGGVQGLRALADRAGLPAGAPAPAVASAIDFVLEGLYAQKKITRSEERGYAANDATERRPNRREEATRDEEVRMPTGKKKYYN